MSNSKAFNRIENLLDAKSFVEMNAKVVARSTDFNINAQKESNDGVITGHGLINGRLVFIYSQDSSVLNGTIGEMHAKKIAAVYEMATKVGAPVIGLIDCGGVRLMESMDSLEAMGSIMACAADASGVIPQVCAIVGNCGGGLSVLPQLSDYIVMSNDAKLFLNSPDAIEDNTCDKCDSSSAQYQFEAGNVDAIGSEDEIFAKVIEVVDMLPSNNIDASNEIDCTDDLNRAFNIDLEDMTAYAKSLSDNGVFVEFKAGFGPIIKTGFIRLNGATVGFVANQKKDGQALVGGCALTKVTDFVKLCDAYSIPLVFAVNAESYKNAFCNEKNFAKNAAKLTLALKNASVPKLTILVENAIGSGYLFFNSKAISSDVVFAYSNTNIALMDADKAAKIICKDSDLDIDDVAAKYSQTHCGVENAAKRGYVDRIIEPVDTRKYVIAELEMLYAKNDFASFKKGSSK